MMFKHIFSIFIFVVISLYIFQSAMAAETDHHVEVSTGHGIHLSDGLKLLLNQEMVAIQQGMMDLIPAISSGNWDEVALIGKNIKASFIMKQKLTKAQKEELYRVLPQDFVELDQAFHKFAGMLAHAAEKKNAEVVNFYFYKLTEACISCHAKFATVRFPGLKIDGEEKEHHH